MSGLANVIDSSGPLARGLSLGLEAKAQDEAKLRASQQFGIESANLRLRQNAYDREVSQQDAGGRLLGALAGKLAPTPQAPAAPPPPSTGLPNLPSLAPTDWRPPMLGGDSPLAAPPPSASPNESGLSGLPLQGLPPHMQDAMVQHGIGALMKKQEDDRAKAGLESEVQRWRQKLSVVPGAPGQWSKNPDDPSLIDATVKALGPNQGQQFANIMRMRDDAKFADVSNVVQSYVKSQFARPTAGDAARQAKMQAIEQTAQMMQENGSDPSEVTAFRTSAMARMGGVDQGTANTVGGVVTAADQRADDALTWKRDQGAQKMELDKKAQAELAEYRKGMLALGNKRTDKGPTRSTDAVKAEAIVQDAPPAQFNQTFRFAKFDPQTAGRAALVAKELKRFAAEGDPAKVEKRLNALWDALPAGSKGDVPQMIEEAFRTLQERTGEEVAPAKGSGAKPTAAVPAAPQGPTWMDRAAGAVVDGAAYLGLPGAKVAQAITGRGPAAASPPSGAPPAPPASGGLPPGAPPPPPGTQLVMPGQDGHPMTPQAQGGANPVDAAIDAIMEQHPDWSDQQVHDELQRRMQQSP